VLAVKVCTAGSTYAEFRAKRLALETCCTANPALADAAAGRFLATLKATDLLWTRQLEHPGLPLSSGGDEWAAMLTLHPDIAAKENYTWAQRNKDADFNPENYVRLGLTLAAQQAGDLLALP
jgi:hypothetical protein